MKPKITILLLLYSLISFGQSRTLLNEMSVDLSNELEGSKLRGSSYWVFVEKNEDSKIQHFRRDRSYPNHLDAIIMNVLKKYVDSLLIGQQYTVNFYHDLYSSKVYAYADTVIINKVFANYDNPLSFPNTARFRFMGKVYDELQDHRLEVDTLRWADWRDPIFILVEPFAKKHQVIKENKLVKYLDSSLNIPWTRASYHGKSMKAIAEIRLDKSFTQIDKLSLALQYPKSVQVSYVLPKQFKNKWIRFANKEPEFPADIMISLIFNPVTLKVENPVIFNGDPEKAMQLIEWIEGLNLTEDMFYWPIIPVTKRTYYFLTP